MVGVAQVVERIWWLCLEVTLLLFFYGYKTPDRLSLIFDGWWDFGHHFHSTVQPNTSGSDDSCKRLYEGGMRFMALYGHLVWAKFLRACNIMLLRQSQPFPWKQPLSWPELHHYSLVLYVIEGIQWSYINGEIRNTSIPYLPVRNTCSPYLSVNITSCIPYLTVKKN